MNKHSIKAWDSNCTEPQSELHHLSIWLQERGVEQVVLESTAQYWRSVWLELEPHVSLHLAQAFSNRAPRGQKHDFKDAERLARRFIAGELILSFVPGGEQRIWRNLTRMKLQFIRDRVRLHGQIECLLEEMRIKLSVVVTDLFGASGLRILHALAQDETDAKNLANLGDERLMCSEEQLIEALTGRSHAGPCDFPGRANRQANTKATRSEDSTNASRLRLITSVFGIPAGNFSILHPMLRSSNNVFLNGWAGKARGQ